MYQFPRVKKDLFVRMSEEEEEYWPQWSATTPASITVDGVKLTQVFAMIQIQLEYLKDRISGKGNKGSGGKSNGSSNSNSNSTGLSIEERVMFEDMMNAVAKLKQEQNIHKQNLQEINSSVVVRFPDLSIRLDSFIGDTNISMAKLGKDIERLLAENNARLLAENEAKAELKSMNQSFNEKITSLTERFDEYIRENEIYKEDTSEYIRRLQGQNDTLKSDVSSLNMEILALKDLNTVYDIRLKNCEKHIDDNTVQVRKLQDAVDNLPATYLQPIHNSISDLYDCKASKEELDLKADLEYADQKADITQLDHLRESLSELGRKLNLQSKELHEGFGKIDKKLDKKTDLIAQWCLKQVRKEIRGFNSPEPNKATEGTDIGKIKCLVCDQPVTQQTRTETVFGGPGMKIQFKPLHQARRENSPSPERAQSPIEEHQNNGGTNDVPSPSPKNTLPKVSSKVNTKLARPGALSPKTAILGQIGSRDDPDYIGDARLRTYLDIPNTSPTANKQRHNNQDLIMNADGRYEPNPLLAHQPDLKYFKDLEE